MRVQRFARDEKPHDFARTFEDRVYATIAKESFHRDWRLAAASQRMRSFIAPAAAHLHRVIRNSPGRLGRPHFAHRGFDAQIACLTIEQ